MKKLVLLGCALLSLLHLHSMPAYPYKVPISVDDETILISIFGDEHHKWAETEDGYTIVQNAKDEWCYAMLTDEGYLTATSFRVGARSSNNANIRNYIAQTPKHLNTNSHQVNRVAPVVRKASGKAIGQRRILVIMMEFTDVKFLKTNYDFDQLFNQTGYHTDGAQGSVKDFYESASYGQLSLTCDIYGPYTATRQMSYYGSNSLSGGDINPYALFTEAIGHVAEEVDLRLYDGDGDGYVDNVHIIYAGYGEEAGGPASAIWAHESTFGRPYQIGNVLIDKYSCAPELRENSGNGISRIGPHCHEIGHALGAMDYYDTDYTTGGQYEGTGNWDVMASGSWNNNGVSPADFNPYVKAHDFGWISPTPLPQGSVTIPPSYLSVDNYFMLSSAANSDYYLIENRSKDGWGAGVPGEGLLLYHIHQGILQARNKINASAPQMCYVVCASAKQQRPSDSPTSYGSINSDGCPYPGSSHNTTFGQNSTPVAFYWDNQMCGIEVNSIKLEENGDITLINNSDGADFKPTETVSLMFEGFEDNPDINTIESQHGTWAIVKDPDNDLGFVGRPKAYEGVHSLQLSAKGNYFDNAESAIELACPKTNSPANMQISGYYTSYGLNGKKANTLNILYKTKDNEEWQSTELLSSVNITWNSFVIDIPHTKLESIQVKGIALAGTILAIDNLEILKEVSDERTDILSISNACSETSVYSITGIKLSKTAKGLYIIRTPNGKTKKIITR